MDNQQKELDALVLEVLDRPLFFIGGQGKSGTTWLQLLLNNHPHIACHGEGHFTDVLAPKLHEAIELYNRFLQHNNKLFGEIQRYPLLDGNHLLCIFRHTVALQLSQHPGFGDARVLGERTPVNLEHSQVLMNAFPDARFIHMIRDPRDIAVSFWFHGIRTDPGWIKSEYGSLQAVLNRMVPAWVNNIQGARARWHQRLHLYQEVLYEKMQQEPQKTLQTILNHLDVDGSISIVTSCLEQASFTKLSRGRERGQENVSSHFRKGIIGDWKNHLDKTAVAEVRKVAGSLFDEFGYE